MKKIILTLILLVCFSNALEAAQFFDEKNNFKMFVADEWSIDQENVKPQGAIFAAYKQTRDYTGTFYIFLQKDYNFAVNETFSDVKPEKKEKLIDKEFEEMKRSPFENPQREDIKFLKIGNNIWLFSMTNVRDVKGRENITIRAKTLKNSHIYSIRATSIGTSDVSIKQIYDMVSSFTLDTEDKK